MWSNERGKFMGNKTYNSEAESTYISVRHGSLILLKKIFELLKERGFNVQTDQRILEQYPSLADSHWEGAKGELRFKSEIYPAGFKLEFYQEVNTKNSNSGYYDFDKFKMMPYLIRCEFLVIRKHICDLLEVDGYENQAKPVFKNSIDDVMYRIKDSCHYVVGKELPEFQIDSYNAKDKDGKQLRNGDVKYFRDHKGRLLRGTIYHNINNMWWVVLNKYEFTNKAAFYLFDLDSEENRMKKLTKKSGYHKPLARIKFEPERTKELKQQVKSIGKEGRMNKANEMLKYLYEVGWTSRLFAFELKDNGRLGLLELESKAWGVHKVHEKPEKLSLYGNSLPMSSSESYWVKALREYTVHSKSTITEWFCKDSNGQGSDAHYWPEVRKVAWEIGALAS